MSASCSTLAYDGEEMMRWRIWRPFVAATRKRIPLGRIMEPEDIAGPAVFLLAAASSGITGIALPVDGGVTAE